MYLSPLKNTIPCGQGPQLPNPPTGGWIVAVPDSDFSDRHYLAI